MIVQEGVVVSQYAIDEIEDLREAGYTVSLRQVMEINALGCAVEYGQPSVFSAPRVSRVGEELLHELSIAAEYWFRDFAGEWWRDESLVIALAWANAHSREVGFFESWTKERAARKAIVKWYRSLACTDSEFNAAFNYVNRTERFSAEVDSGDESDDCGALDPPDGLTDLVHECLAMGLDAEMIGSKTRREMVDILERHTRQQLVAGKSKNQIAPSIKKSAENKFLKYVDKLKECQKTA